MDIRVGDIVQRIEGGEHHGMKIGEFGTVESVNEDIIKNTNNSKCIKYTVNPNKKQKKPNNTNNLKALYQKRKNRFKKTI